MTVYYMDLCTLYLVGRGPPFAYWRKPIREGPPIREGRATPNYIVPTMLTELLYPLQYGDTPLVLAAREGHTTCVEHLLSTPGIDVDTAFQTL